MSLKRGKKHPCSEVISDHHHLDGSNGLVGGWAYPSEEYEIQWEGWHPIHDMENKKKCLKPPTSVIFFLKYVSIFMPAPISRKDLSLAAARSPCYWLNLRCPPWCQRRHTRHRRPGFSGGRRRGPFRYHLAVKCRTWFTHIPPEYKIRAVLKDLAWNKRYNVCFNRISECRPRLFEKNINIGVCLKQCFV